MSTKTFAVIVAAGSSARMKGIDKILFKIHNRPVIYWTLQKFIQPKFIDSIILVVKDSAIPFYQQLINSWSLSKIISVVAGGATRQESVRKGIEEVERLGSCDDDIVAIHDGARPLVSYQSIKSIVLAAKKYGAAILGVPSKDTIKQVSSDLSIEKTLNRENVWLAQTPQAARMGNLKKAIELSRTNNTLATDEASLFEQANIPVKIIRGDYVNIKITSPEDLKIVSSLTKKH